MSGHHRHGRQAVGSPVPLLRSRVGEAPDSTRALWHASRRQPTMEQMFLQLLLLFLPLWGSSNATLSLAFYFLLHAGSRLASLATCLLLRAPPMFSPKSSNRFVKVRIDKKNIDLLCSQESTMSACSFSREVPTLSRTCFLFPRSGRFRRLFPMFAFKFHN